ncbi:unnamed protein product [Dicrocoelium dendriticum]|nr:unnamed protein product [Dicrocoelium dendriticum]
MLVPKFNVTLNTGVMKEDGLLSSLTSNTKSILGHLVHATNGNYSEITRMLDQILSETQIEIKNLTESQVTDQEFYERLTKLGEKHSDTLKLVETVYHKTHRSSLLSSNRTETENFVQYPQSEYAANKYRMASSPKRLQNDKGYLRDKPVHSVPNNQATQKTQYSPVLKHSMSIDAEDNETPASSGSTRPCWRNRITIPKPFEMCKRDEEKNRDYRLTRSKNALLDDIHDKENQIQPGYGKAGRFHARPIPAHCLVPLFESMVEQQAKRRRAVHANAKEILKATEKPFKFTLRERVAMERNCCSIEPSPTTRPTFRDRSAGVPRSVDTGPDSLRLPKHIYENRLERMYEEALVREVRRQLRAQRLLNSASIPPGMEERQRLSELRNAKRLDRNRQKVWEPHVGAQRNQSNQFTAKPSPNFKRIHWETEKNLRRLWRPAPEPTRTKPFKLRTAERTKCCITRSRSVDYHIPNRKDNPTRAHLERGAFQSLGFRPQNSRQSTDFPSPAKARGTILRENHIRELIKKACSNVKMDKEAERLRMERQRQLYTCIRNSLGESITSPETVVRSEIARKKRELSQQCSARQADYKRELKEIHRRVSARPLLIAQQSQKVARKRAENLFSSTLKCAGLDADLILQEARKNNDSKDARCETHVKTTQRNNKIDSRCLLPSN